MSNLDDGFDEILDHRMIQSPEAEYRATLAHLKRSKDTMIDVFASLEFSQLKAKLRRIVGDLAALDIMERNL